MPANALPSLPSPGARGGALAAPATPQHVTSQQMAAAGLRAFMRLAQLWGLSIDEQRRLLGDPPRSTFFAWRKAPERARLSRDTLERLSYLLGIHKALEILLPDSAAADGWVRRPNAAQPFAGRTALEVMLQGQVADLHAVRAHLDAARGGGWS